MKANEFYIVIDKRGNHRIRNDYFGIEDTERDIDKAFKRTNELNRANGIKRTYAEMSMAEVAHRTNSSVRFCRKSVNKFLERLQSRLKDGGWR